MQPLGNERVIRLDERAQQELQSFARSHSLPHALVLRAKIVLMAAEGTQSRVIAAELGLSRHTVGKWRGRFVRGGIRGVVRRVSTWKAAEHRGRDGWRSW